MLTKEKILERLKELPEEFELDDFLEGLFFMEKIEQARKESQSNEVFSNKEMKKRIESWS